MSFLPKPVLFAAAFAVLATPVLSESFKRIRKEADFRSAVVGKTLTSGPASFVLHSDGTASGDSSKGPILGAWKWSGKFFCRNLTIGGTAIGNDCQVVKISGTTVVFIGQKGKGPKRSYTMN